MNWKLENTDYSCRWIDQRKGILEVRCNDKAEWRLSFHDMTFKQLYRSFGDWKSDTDKMVVIDGMFCNAPHDEDSITTLLFDKSVSQMVLTYYEKWLNRVMLADDINENKRSAKNRESGSKTAENNPPGKRPDREGSLHASGHDSDPRRVPLHQTGGNLPMGARERLWRIKPR